MTTVHLYKTSTTIQQSLAQVFNVYQLRSTIVKITDNRTEGSSKTMSDSSSPFVSAGEVFEFSYEKDDFYSLFQIEVLDIIPNESIQTKMLIKAIHSKKKTAERQTLEEEQRNKALITGKNSTSPRLEALQNEAKFDEKFKKLIDYSYITTFDFVPQGKSVRVIETVYIESEQPISIFRKLLLKGFGLMMKSASKQKNKSTKNRLEQILND